MTDKLLSAGEAVKAWIEGADIEWSFADRSDWEPIYWNTTIQFFRDRKACSFRLKSAPARVELSEETKRYIDNLTINSFLLEQRIQLRDTLKGLARSLINSAELQRGEGTAWNKKKP